MAQTYQVDYIVNVAGNAQTGLNTLTQAFNKLGPSIQVIDRLNKRITKLNTLLNNKKWKMTLDTSQPEAKITSLENRIAAMRKSLAAIAGGGGTKGAAAARGPQQRQFIKHNGSLYKIGQGKPSDRLLGAGYQWTKAKIPIQAFNNNELAAYNSLLQRQTALRQQLQKAQRNAGATAKVQKELGRVSGQIGRMTSGYVATYKGTSVVAPASAFPKGYYKGVGGRGVGMGSRYSPRPNNLTYKLFGPTPLTNNGGMAIDMLKGMGIAYGIAGIGQAISGVLHSAMDYDNTMKTVENILHSNDKSSNFSAKYNRMENTIRQIGIQTKFKVTEVADAAKFLAMAGLSVDDIRTSMPAIANIALVGDTNLGETADLVTNIMTGYNMKSHQMARASDVMTKTFTRTNVTLPEIAESYKYAASLLSAGGIRFEESTAAIGILGDAGIKGSQAGTTLRTILNNIINPRGKKRQEEWAKTGIKTTDEFGRVRSLAEIFTELSEQNLSVEQFYKLFDKTAVQGAVALAKHVEKWNDVIEDNFMSRGLASRLAEEKKNTIQGLWAQLTSTWTDDGVMAFKGVEDEIKNLLRSGTAWLKEEDSQKKVNVVFKSFMKFIDLIVDATEYFYNFFDKFGWAINWIIKLQLYMWPLIKTFTILKSLSMGLIGVFRVGAGLVKVISELKTLTLLLGQAGATKLVTGSVLSYLVTGGGTAFLPYLSEQIAVATGGGAAAGGGASSIFLGNGYNAPKGTSNGNLILDRNGQPIGNPVKPKATGKWKFGKLGKFGQGMTGFGGALLGAGLGATVGGAMGGDTGAIIGGVACTIGGGMLSSWLTSGSALALFTNPVGWGVLAAAAVAAVCYGIYDVHKGIKEVNKQNQKWIESLHSAHVDTLDLTQENALLIGNMRIFSNHLANEQEQVKQSIKFFEDYWAAKTGRKQNDDSVAFSETPEGKAYKKDLEVADQWFSQQTNIGPIARELAKAYGTYKKDANGKEVLTLGGRTWDWGSDHTMYEAEAGWWQTAKLGAHHEARQNALEKEAIERISSVRNASSVAGIISELKSHYLPAVNHDYDDLQTEDYEKLTPSQLYTTQAYQAGFKPVVEQYLATWTKFGELLTKFEAGKDVSATDVQAFLKMQYGQLFDVEKGGVVGSPKWFGYVKDLVANYQTYGFHSKDAAENYILETYSQFFQWYSKLDDKFKPLFGSYFDRGLIYNALPDNLKKSMPTWGYTPGKRLGDKAFDESGVTYTWSQLSSPYAVGQYGWVHTNADGKQTVYTPETQYGNLTLTTQAGKVQTNEPKDYLNGYLFPSAFATQYPTFISQQPASNRTAYNFLPNYYAPSDTTSPYNYLNPNLLRTPVVNQGLYASNVNSAAYQPKPQMTVYTDKPVAQGNVLTATNGIYIANLNVSQVTELSTDDLVNKLRGAANSVFTLS